MSLAWLRLPRSATSSARSSGLLDRLPADFRLVQHCRKVHPPLEIRADLEIPGPGFAVAARIVVVDIIAQCYALGTYLASSGWRLDYVQFLTASIPPAETTLIRTSLKRGELEVAEMERFTAQLENLPIDVDPFTANQAFGRIVSLAGAYNLSSYDAAYLELAIR